VTVGFISPAKEVVLLRIIIAHKNLIDLGRV
jgi:hypothetical protein